MGVCAKERKGVTAEVLMATPCTKTPVRGYTYERRGRFIDDDDDVYYYIRWRLQLERFICLFLFLFRLLFHSSFSRQLDFNWDATVSVEQGSKVLNVSAIAREVARLGRGRHAESCALAPNSARA